MMVLNVGLVFLVVLLVFYGIILIIVWFFCKVYVKNCNKLYVYI